MTNMIKKKQKLRNIEYYDAQAIFDDLYKNSKNNYKFNKLMDLITNEHNIELAYRNIKKNTGSKTGGTNNKTIDDIQNLNNNSLVEYINKRLINYHPHTVRRVEIPKENGKVRPLGIPTIEDRIVQQCILQILEPICEAKFYKHSYGFRPNRNTHHAIARSYHLMQSSNLHYVVDIDIKGFFDNVNHGKLLKQMWTLGIQDKHLLCIISKMLKAPIKNEGYQTKGTPQGGILSPLLSNIVLNELDWWIANQWESFDTKHKYSYNSGRYYALRKSKLKEIYIVRYADDFKIFCRDYKTANKIFTATKMWLKERLHLEISPEKSKVVNLRKNYSEFLGFKMKVRNKGSKRVVKSHISDKAKKKIIMKLKTHLIKLQKKTTMNNILIYNSMVLGLHNYYKIATHISYDFGKIAFIVNKSLYNRTHKIRSNSGTKSKAYEKFYGSYNYKTVYVWKIALFPIGAIKTNPPMNFSQETCNYTKNGREKIHQKLQNIDYLSLKYLMNNPIHSESIELNDNRISLFVGQNGMCSITRDFLEIGSMDVHHKVPKDKGGSDKYSNLTYIKRNIHILIHSTHKETIEKYMKIENLNKKAIKKVNELRILVGNFEI
ncbi:MAG: group II intron reverse transcriptase/maturase [Paraclostridium dentum]|uniref:Group II intron reverse transcriptase/maturase n=2 Tax=Paraclostridium bifermentans TaxID=1490 RepID=A0A5P3XBI1_PARBF|nr:group II intron reverse transcriptase/maturase [Paraclostridium bifermentans]QEZ67494.1 group II intron reverse transcriptase/maturase [Paraclostridium bifermentans]QEZ70331.1 group II intron reverse transcriptase/maturase [Paraclostridium bifermentans]